MLQSSDEEQEPEAPPRSLRPLNVKHPVDIRICTIFMLKDKYPHRVRNTLMQLNRAVCLEYPEYNDEEYPDHFPLRIKEYLLQIVGSSDCILEDVITPYGYHIDFLINLNNKEEAVEFASVDIKKRVALLLMRQYGFTRFYTHLKGKYQLKKRHLEMLGYTVSVIKFNEWINLLYAEERFEYLSKMIWHNQPHCSFNTCNKRIFPRLSIGNLEFGLEHDLQGHLKVKVVLSNGNTKNKIDNATKGLFLFPLRVTEP
ncbi:hypothetical protein NQ318_003642 [Aromia moschata]|uniref:RAP domain-containing protein n=1 Tax=Aromia moschata TaxID=1265417 RepID=A0AAV8Y1M7_9CUCU|nr:hypothetical protein NQ318_003642 [Aromia moschata]